jgi:hypothetical protein
MNIESALKVAQRALSNNSPAILTGMAVAGVVTTAILAVRATPKAIRQINAENFARDTNEVEGVEPPILTTVDVVKITWKGYIPAAGMGLTTIACIIGANTIHSRRSAVLMSAYSLAETALKEYRAKVVETLGINNDQKVQDSIAKDRLEKNPVANSEVFITGLGEQLCYESLSGRYFKCDIETIRKAQNDINAHVVNEMYMSLNDFYTLIGLHPTVLGDEMGWCTDNMMDLMFSSHLTNGVPCLSIDYRVQPVLNYYKLDR